MKDPKLSFSRNQAILTSTSVPCRTKKELIESEPARKVVQKYINHLQEHESSLLSIFPPELRNYRSPKLTEKFLPVLSALLDEPLRQISSDFDFGEQLLKNRETFHQFIEKLYDFWRDYNRFYIKPISDGKLEGTDRPYLEFNRELDTTTDLLRSAYRDIAENITGTHPYIYRQVAAGAEVGLVVEEKDLNYPENMKSIIGNVPVIEQVTIRPPLVIDPPMNKRTGRFREVNSNPLLGAELDSDKWLCYPAQVGDIRIDLFFHRKFLDLGTSLANLFDLVTGEDLKEKPDAVYTYGLDPGNMDKYGKLPTVFYQDEENDILYGAIPREDRFGYFGYVKKLMLTLHNIKVMKRGRMPIHGAMTKITLRGGQKANIVLVGDSGAGKSETLEAFRVIGERYIKDIDIICDDMGSLGIGPSGEILGYGTEKGAFVRLDDLQKGYAFSQLDRAIFMSPQKTNARALMPVTPMEKVLEGMPVTFFLYANNYEEIDESHPIIEEFESPEAAKSVFKEGARMAKGTTSEKGLVHAYFANPFGPPQFREVHEEIADKFFSEIFEREIFVGQMRTRLGIEGYETKGPETAARELLQLIKRKA